MQKARAGKTELAKKDRRSRYDTFTDWARDAAEVITVPVARFLAGLGFHPNTVTLVGFLSTLGVGAVLSTGRLTLGGWLLAITAPIDAVDGALARLVGEKSRFGAFLDSTLDRFSDMALLFGLAIHFLRQGDSTELVLALVALAGSTMVSYVRARAESEGFSCKVGVMTRLERVVVLAVGLIVGQPTLALWVLAVGTVLTVIHRVIHVYLQSRKASLGQ